MQIKTEKLLNPNNCHLSLEAKKRLKWLYMLYCQCNDNIAKAAHKIGVSREWLSRTKSKFERYHQNPCNSKPLSRAPHNTSKRKRIPEEMKNKMLEIRELSIPLCGLAVL